MNIDNRRYIYKGMVQRCYNTNDPKYHLYGGRGIKICDRWRDTGRGFKNFCIDMGERPSMNHCIDRINNDGHYEESNCRWVTWDENRKNKRRKDKPIRKKHIDLFMFSIGFKECCICHEIKALNNFYVGTDTVFGFTSSCKSCISSDYKRRAIDKAESAR